MLPYLLVFGAAAVSAAVATPVVRRISVRFGAIDHPSDRKVHPKPTPTLGGVAILFAFLAAMAVAYAIPAFREHVFRTTSEPIGVILAALVIVAVGMYDDLRPASAPVKLAGQILAAGVMILAGIQLIFFWFPNLGVIVLGPDLGVPLTVLWVLAMINAVNLIDGLDGLAAGVVVIATAGFFAFTFLTEQANGAPPSAASMLSAIAAGAALGFLPHNFHPAKIFMGDSGSMLLGVILAGATISGVGKSVQAPTETELAALAVPVIVPLLVLAVPFIDVVFAVGRRMKRGSPVTHPDKEHIHHRLLEIGHSHREAVLLIYFWSAILAGAALTISFVKSRPTAVALLLVAVALVAVTLVPRLLRPGIRTAEEGGSDTRGRGRRRGGGGAEAVSKAP
ncbi:MAG: undecaprenyl/decaprenyl-phosphate alpha-N-acetylglucosaminyl 1-phosphate transferase [Actinobacteria bacterium]|nr:undecaprenyl/decaprenyl-phosphate alpha-N-acetylglucosaminyl 1-phosphate transferase [Actinomycetota bacterium]